MFVIPTANDLLTFVKDFTGSSNDEEIKKCIFMAELSMRNIELPALRCDPYSPENIGVADENGRIPIPGDMNKPILFFKQGGTYNTSAQGTGDVGTTTITLSTYTNLPLSSGMLVTGSGVATGATIQNITGNSGSQIITVTLPNVGAVSGTINFTSTANRSSQTGPWIVYDRIGDRDIITQSMIAQLYLQPVNVPAVIRGKFSEVGQVYEFLPYIAQGDLINMYYYKAWPLLFSPTENPIVALTATVTIDGFNPPGTYYCTLSGINTDGLNVGDSLSATDDTGVLGGIDGIITIDSIMNSTSITYIVTIPPATITPVAGTVTDVTLYNQTVQSNAVLATWPEGYVYATLREYYIKRHNDQDAQVYDAKYKEAWNVVEDQNNLGKWSGGHTRLTSVWQPRQYRQYNIK